MRNKLQNTPLESTHSLSSNNLVSLPALDYNIVEDMKNTCAKISLYELTKLTS